MSRVSQALELPPMLDFDAVAVGRPVTHNKLVALADHLHHHYSWRRKTTLSAIYQRDQSENARGHSAALDMYTWQYHTSLNCRRLYVVATTLGVSATGGAPKLVCKTTTDAVGVETSRVIGDGGATFPTDLQLHEFAPISATADFNETITIEQKDATKFVNIVGLKVQELPITFVDTTDVGLLNILSYPPGQDIAVTQYDQIADAVQTLRKSGKKILWQNQKQMSTTSTSLVDFVTKSGANLLKANYYPSPWLPETADPRVGVYYRVLAEATGGGTGQVDLVMTGGTASIAGIGALGLYPAVLATANINQAAGTLSYQGKTSVGTTTLTVYGATVWEAEETGA